MYFLSIFQDIHNEFRLHVQKLKNVSLKKIICNLDFNVIKVQLGFDMSSWNCKFSILSHLFLLPLHIVSKLFLYRITFYTFITGSDNKLRKCFKSAELTCDQWQSVFDVPCDNLESESMKNKLCKIYIP